MDTSTDPVQVVVARARCFSNAAQAALELADGNVEAAIQHLKETSTSRPLTDVEVVNHLRILRLKQGGQGDPEMFFRFPPGSTAKALLESDFC